MSDYPGVTKAEVHADITPIVIEYLEKHGQTFTDGHDTVGHQVYAHAASEYNPTDYPASVVYEGDCWADEFVEEMNGCVEIGERTYDVQTYSSYEINVLILDDYRDVK